MKLTPLLLAATLAAQAEDTNEVCFYSVNRYHDNIPTWSMTNNFKSSDDSSHYLKVLCLLKVESVTNVNTVQPPPMVDSNGCVLAVYQFPIKQTNITTTYHIGTSDGTELFTVKKGSK